MTIGRSNDGADVVRDSAFGSWDGTGQLAEEEEDVLKEAFFAPSDAEMLPALFEALSRAAEMNPEPGEDDDGMVGEAQGLGGAVLEMGR